MLGASAGDIVGWVVIVGGGIGLVLFIVVMIISFMEVPRSDAADDDPLDEDRKDFWGDPRNDWRCEK